MPVEDRHVIIIAVEVPGIGKVICREVATTGNFVVSPVRFQNFDVGTGG